MKEIISALEELNGDSTVPKNIKNKIIAIIQVLNEKVEKPIKISKALTELEDVSDDVNMQAYTRTQIYNIISMLESA